MSAAFLTRDWIDWRWRTFRAIAYEISTDFGERTFEAARQADRTPSLIDVTWLPYPDDWEPGWQDRIRRLRPHIPNDCFPFSIGLGHHQFVTTRMESAAELEALITHLNREQLGVEVRGCFADEDCDYGRAWDVNHPIFPDAECRRDRPAAATSLAVRCSSHQGLKPQFSSVLGLLDRDLPAARKRAANGELTVAAVTPVGENWKKRVGTTDADWIRFGVKWVVLTLAVELDGVAFELDQETGASLGLLLDMPLAESERELAALTETLREEEYEAHVGDGYFAQVARPGEIEFHSACRAVTETSDGSTEVDALRREIGSLA